MLDREGGKGGIHFCVLFVLLLPIPYQLLLRIALLSSSALIGR